MRLFHQRPDETAVMRENRVTQLMQQMSALMSGHSKISRNTQRQSLSHLNLDVPIEMHTHTALPFSTSVKNRLLISQRKFNVTAEHEHKKARK